MIRLREMTKDGTPYAVKVACTVWSGGKFSDYLKELPITILALRFYSSGKCKNHSRAQKIDMERAKRRGIVQRQKFSAHDELSKRNSIGGTENSITTADNIGRIRRNF